jgi:hypothetical protein
MCVIIDNSIRGIFFARGLEYVPIWDWILLKDGKLVTGGENKRELSVSATAKAILYTWKSTGKAIFYSDAEVDSLTSNLAGKCTSNDPHVIALAAISNARILCADDSDLENDFRNRHLVSKNGKIYKYAKHHKKLLAHDNNCPASKP